MRLLLFLLGLYMAHRVLLALSPAYATRMRRLDRQLTWVSIMLVLYLLINLFVRLLLHTR